MADNFADNELVKSLAGKALDELAPSKGWPTLEQRLLTPDFEFGIIAGGQGDDEGYLESIPGDDDMLLSVDTTKLDGASDFALVKRHPPDAAEERAGGRIHAAVPGEGLLYLPTG